MLQIEGGNDLRTPAELAAARAELTRELAPAEEKGSRGLRLLGSLFIGTGLLLLPTLIFSAPGAILIALGCLLRLAARP